MATQAVKFDRVSTLAGTTVPGKLEAVYVDGSYLLYLTDNTGTRRPPAVMAHGHSISDITGLQVALDGKALSVHTHSNATTSSPGFMSAADKIKLDASVNYTHPNSGVTSGTYRSVTVDALGHVTAGSNPTTLDGYGITDRFVSINPTTGVSVDTLNAVNINNLSYASQFYVTAGVNTPSSAASSGFVNTSATGSTSFFQMYFDPATQDAFYYRRKNTSVLYAWEQVASRSWVQSQIPVDANNYIYRGTYNGVDADTLISGGWYDNGAGSPTTTNIPVLKSGFINVTPYRAGAFNAVSQDFVTAGTGANLNRRFYRTSWNGAYTAWLEVASREWANGAFSPISHSHTWTEITGKPTTFAPASHLLNSHSDVSTAAASTGMLLRYSVSQWQPWTPNFLTGITSAMVTTALGYTPLSSLPAHNLNTHSDVNAPSPTTGQLLRRSGSEWQAWTPNYITGINSVDVTSALGYTPYNSSNPNGYISSLPAHSLNNHSDVNAPSPATGQLLRRSGSNWEAWTPNYGTGNGTVTQVGLIVPSGFSVLSSPVNGSGNLQFGFAAGYSLPTNFAQEQWNSKVGVSGSISNDYLVKWSGGAVAQSRILDTGSGNINCYTTFQISGGLQATGLATVDSAIVNNSLQVAGLATLSAGLRVSGGLFRFPTYSRAGRPSSPSAGDAYFQTDISGSSARGIKYYDGSQWAHVNYDYGAA